MSSNGRSPCKSFSVSHLLSKDTDKQVEYRGKEKEGTYEKERFEDRELEKASNCSQVSFFENTSKNDKNTQALNLAERLAGE